MMLNRSVFSLIEAGRDGYPGLKGQRGEHGSPGQNVSNDCLYPS